MQDKHLFLISITIAVFGLLLLIFLPLNDAKKATIKELNSYPLNTNVELSGIASGIYKTKEVLIFNLTDSTGTVKIVLFSPKNIKITESQNLNIIGSVKTYKNLLEIHANSIENY